jgi:hypothetical protein
MLGLAGLVTCLLPLCARAGLHTFQWVADPEPSPYNTTLIDRGALIVSVPGVAAGEPFGPGDAPMLVDLFFSQPREEYRFTGRIALAARFDGSHLDAGGVEIRLATHSGAGPAEVALRFAGHPDFDAVTTPSATFSGHWRAGNNGADASVRASFVHRAGPTNLRDGVTLLNHPLLNGHPEARFVISKNWHPGGSGGTYDPHEIFVYYNGIDQRWAISRADRRDFVPGSAFNVLIPRDDGRSFRHVTAPANVFANWTWISSPLTDLNPDAELIVTPVLEIAGDRIQTHPIGVWYEEARGAWTIFDQTRAAMPVTTRFNVWVVPEASRHLVHVARAENTGGNLTVLDSPVLNANAHALVQFSQRWLGVYNPNPVGIYANGVGWSLFNQNLGAMPLGAGFNVFDPPLQSAFQIARKGPTAVYIPVELPFTGHQPDTLLLVTQDVTGGEPALNAREMGVTTSIYGTHSVGNLDTSPVPIGTAVNLHAPPVDLATFVHLSAAENLTSNWTRMTHPLLDGRPDARAFATPHANPHNSGELARVSRVFGVWYDGSHWNIFNQDSSAMPPRVSFNVHVAKPTETSFVHRVTAGNTSGSRSRLDHPDLDGNPAARLIVTQNWNPPGSLGVYNDHPAGVRWEPTSARWQIVNLDGADLPLGAAFNVLIPEPVCPDADFDGTCDADDLCPHFAARHNLADIDEDGRGDECECGDANGDGRITVADLVAINDVIFGRRPSRALCDANGDGLCNVNDIVAANRGIFGAELYCERHPAP